VAIETLHYEVARRTSTKETSEERAKNNKVSKRLERFHRISRTLTCIATWHFASLALAKMSRN